MLTFSFLEPSTIISIGIFRRCQRKLWERGFENNDNYGYQDTNCTNWGLQQQSQHLWSRHNLHHYKVEVRYTYIVQYVRDILPMHNMVISQKGSIRIRLVPKTDWRCELLKVSLSHYDQACMNIKQGKPS